MREIFHKYRLTVAQVIAAASSEVLTEEIQRIARLRAQNIEQDIYSRILI
jgi:hypothetical protein